MSGRNAKRLVKCYPLRAALTPAQWAAVEPFARETFTEMWDVLNARPSRTRTATEESPEWTAVKVLLDAAGCFTATGRTVEARLYRRALSIGISPVMAKGRRK